MRTVDFCLFSSLVLAILVPSWMLLVAWAARKRWLREQQRPLEDRIADIRNDASLVMRGLQGTLDHFKDKLPQGFDWIPPTIES